MKVVTAEQMQLMDAEAINTFGILGIQLMERAGAQCVSTIVARFPKQRNQHAVIFSGKGNNGGDGFVIARLLFEHGWRTTVIITVSTAEIGGDAKVNLGLLPDGVEIHFSPDLYTLSSSLKNLGTCTIIVDALFGTGLKHPVEGIFKVAVEAINSAGRWVLAVDIPSGIHGTTGKVLGIAVKADMTVTFASAKLGQVLYPGRKYAGVIKTVDIGIPAQVVDNAPGYEFIDEEAAASIISPRDRCSHKGSFGHCLIIAGSTGHTGAAALAAIGAVRSGAGLVTLAAPASLNHILEVKTVEAMTLPLSDGDKGFLIEESASEIMEALSGSDTVALGPGISRQNETIKLAHRLIKDIDLPLVVDADGLNALSEDTSLLLQTKAPFVVITPHPGEMARLVNQPVAEVEADRIATASRFAAQYRVYVVLKGSGTIIAAPDGRVAVNGSGNPGMASGGMGDVLTGVITALLGQGYLPYDACRLGVYVHGYSADLCAEKKGEIGITASDVAEHLPYAFKKLFEVKNQLVTNTQQP